LKSYFNRCAATTPTLIITRVSLAIQKFLRSELTFQGQMPVSLPSSKTMVSIVETLKLIHHAPLCMGRF